MKKSTFSKHSEAELVASIWAEIQTRLEKEKDRVYEEIVNYPPPIPACDAQFNYLLEERARISQEVSRVHELSTKNLTRREAVEHLNEFIRASAYIDAGQKQKLLSNLNEALGEDQRHLSRNEPG
jgi:chorismate mutase